MFNQLKDLFNALSGFIYGRVRAAVLRTRTAAVMPRDVYIHNPGREVYSIWHGMVCGNQKTAFLFGGLE